MTGTNIHSLIDFDDVQGLVRFAHGRLSESAFILLKIKNVIAAREWLAQAPVTTSAPVSPLPDSALQLAFTAAGQIDQQGQSLTPSDLNPGPIDLDPGRTQQK